MIKRYSVYGKLEKALVGSHLAFLLRESYFAVVE